MRQPGPLRLTADGGSARTTANDDKENHVTMTVPDVESLRIGVLYDQASPERRGSVVTRHEAKGQVAPSPMQPPATGPARSLPSEVVADVGALGPAGDPVRAPAVEHRPNAE
ncbi:hypothetical protein GCM10010211_80190 [Streptomyces albospinus]|uniref:Uncharacterized protein n=1 Tax=Streptomyces albospinus TaxID=285515 RepID=A0ABQ2VNC8_9ACTN|nr:hypothetical protein GCM10010211_80190 [Streptomyces albospinus]